MEALFNNFALHRASLSSYINLIRGMCAFVRTDYAAFNQIVSDPANDQKTEECCNDLNLIISAVTVYPDYKSYKASALPKYISQRTTTEYLETIESVSKLYFEYNSKGVKRSAEMEIEKELEKILNTSIDKE